MKMKKKLFGMILTAALIVSQAATVFAAGSKEAGVSPAGDSEGYYVVSEGTAGSDEAKDFLGGKRMITDIFTLDEVNGGVLTEDGKYLVTLEVTSLTSSMTGVQILYYNTAEGKWMMITPSDIDYANQLITFVIDQLPAQICIIADEGTSVEDSAEGMSPQTGVMSGWGLWTGTAIILAGVSLAAYRKSKKA